MSLISNPDIFAVLIPCDKNNLAGAAFRLPENGYGYCKAAEGSARGIAEEPTIDSREPTPAPGASLEQSNYDSADRILLRLDNPPKDPSRGWQFGTDSRTCDCLLGHRGTKGISSCHFRITITQSFWVELHDKSRYGTCVGHNGQAKRVVVQDDKRLLSYEPGARKQWEEVIVYVPDTDGLAFKVNFPNHGVGGGEYWRKLRTFVNDSGRALPSVHGLGLDSNPPTVPISRQPRTHPRLPTYLDDEEIGHGEFASVSRVIDARDGQVYAAKKFKTPFWTQDDGKKRKLEQKNWLTGIWNEYTIMKNNPHPNIVQVLYFQEQPKPFVVMEYCSLGNLKDLQGVEPEQYVSVFRQILVGLRHLHSNRIAHRDLKPANLLVANRHSFHIKISDFGLSKVVANDGVLRTMCGTPLYAAPEVYLNNRTGYRPSVDIWSAGVIILEFIFGLPAYANNNNQRPTEWIEHWANVLLERIDDLDENDDRVIDIIKHMVTMEIADRFTANQCLQKGCDNGLFKRRSDGQIVDIDTSSKDEDTKTTTGADAEIILSDADTLNDGNSHVGAAAPEQQLTESAISKASGAPTLLIGDLWSDEDTGRQTSANAPNGPSTLTRGSDPEPPARRQRISSQTSSWSWTIGLGDADSDGGFGLDGESSKGIAAGLVIKKDHFTDSCKSQFSSKDETQEESSIGQGPVALPDPVELTSFEKRVLQALQA